MAAELRSQQLTAFVRYLPTNSAANLVNALIVALIVWPFVPGRLLFAWLLPTTGIVVWHLYRWNKNRHVVPPAKVSPRGPRRAILWSIVSGLLWGATAAFVPYIPDYQWILLLIITAGMTAGASATLAAIPGAAVGFILAAAAPWLVFFAIQEETINQAVILMIAVFLFAMLLTTRSVHATVMQVIQGRHKNLSLLQQFRGERDEWFEISDTSEAFALFDDRDRLLLWNENYRRSLSLPPDCLKRGARHEDLLRLSSPPTDVARGLMSFDDWVAQRSAQLQRAAGIPRIEQLANGRWLRSTSRRTKRGRKFVLHVDITELKNREAAQKRANEELQQSERRFQDFAEASADWFWEMDQDLRLTYVSGNIETQMGVASGDLIGKSRQELIQLADPTVWQEHLKALADHEPFRDFVYLGVSKELALRWVRVSGVPVFSEDGTFQGYRGSGSDVTKEIETLEALRVSEEQLRLVIDSLPVLICYIDRGERYRFINKACKSWYGLSNEQIVGHTAQDIHAESYERFRPHIAAVLKGEAVDFEVSNTYGDGIRRDVKVIYVPHLGEGGLVEGFFALAEDMTQQKMIEAERELAKRVLRQRETRLHELQRQFEQVSRSNALGQLSSALAHELNQPLAAIMNYVRAGSRILQSGQAPNGEKVDELLAKAAEQAERAGDVIRRLRSLFEAGEQEISAHDINQVVEDAAALALLDAPVMGITFQLKLAEGLPPVTMDRIQIQQVVLNLVRNAVEALADQERRHLVIQTTKTNGGIVVSVCDSGPGLPSAVRERLFEPFVSQKVNGMGLGLSLSHRIVEAHEGRIWSEPGAPNGTCFSFMLPVKELLEAAE